MKKRNYRHEKKNRYIAFFMLFMLFCNCVFMHSQYIEVKAASQAESLVSMARSQLGTKERSSGSDDILYNDWYYGRRVNNYGVSAKYAWCAVFVSWCAEKAGLSTSIVPKTASTTDMKNRLINSGGVSHLKGSGYSPQCGDIIFFGSNASQHVGIVEYSSQGRVYYIDGNNTQTNPHGVHYSNCSLSYGSLWGFVTPNYSSAASSNPQPSIGKLVNSGDSFSARIRHCASGKVITNSNYNAVIGTSMNEKIARQIWKFTRNSNGSYRIQSCLNLDYCLELHNFDDFDGGNVSCAPMNGSTAQNWFIYQRDDGTLYFQPECSKSRILDLAGGNTSDGNNMHIWTVNDTESQKFRIDICSEVIDLGEDFSGFILNTNYWKPIMQDGKNNVVLGSENSENMARQLWHFVRKPQNGYYTIQSYYNGKVLTVEDSKDEDGANVICSENNGSASQQWFVLMRPDGSCYLKAGCSGRNLDLSGDNKADGTNIQMWSINNTEAQTFSVYGLDGGRDKMSYTLISDNSSIDVGEKTKITVSNALYSVDYKLHVVSPDGKTNTINLGTRNTYDFSADAKGIYKIYATVKSPVSSYSGSVNENCITIAVGYGYETSVEQSVIFQGHLYQLVEKQNVNWRQAKVYCEEKSSYLAAITSQEENEEVAKLLNNYGRAAYIGGVRRDTESFRWVVASGEEFTYSNWRSGEPNFHNHGTCQIRDPYGEYGKENYIGMYEDGTWNDYMIFSSAVNAFVMESERTSLQVSSPTNIIYKVGDKFDKNSIVVEAGFSDGSKRRVTDYTVSGFNPHKEGTQKVTISYYGLTQSIDVKVESDTAEKEHDYMLSDTKKATCIKDGYHKYVCSNCGGSYTETISKTGHTWDAGKVTLKATATTNGICTYKCISCGETKTKQIPATGQTEGNSPDDKGNSNTGKKDKDEGKNPDKTQEDIDDKKNPDDESESDDNEPDMNGKESEDVDEEPDVLEAGDVVEDAKSGDEYEIISIDGNVICVEYMESANPKAAVIKIPSTIKTEDRAVCKVTSISKCAFKNNRKLRKVVIGGNVTAIGTKAFFDCRNLTSVTIGKNVKAIGANAFSNCAKLKSLLIPGKVTKIGSNAFSGCKKLKKLDIKSRKLATKGVNKKAFKGIPAKAVIQVPKDRRAIYKKLLCQKGLSRKNKIK